MATKKAAKKSTKKAAKTTRKVAKKSAKKSAKKTSKKAAAAKKTTKKAAKKSSAPSASGGGDGKLRVRMYRIGFGDFFLITVPTKAAGPQHILIDCGVHAGNIGTMKDCVQDLIKVTNRTLALVIATHYHADHLSGFASNFDEFAQFEVGMVWITNRLDPKNAAAMKFKAQIRSLAGEIQFRLGLRAKGQDGDSEEELATQRALFKVTDALGLGLDEARLGAAAKEGSNEKALRLLTEGFKNGPPVKYYQGGDTPELPPSLKGVISAQLLAPAPIDSGGDFATADNATEQYLAAAAEDGLPPDELRPFDKEWPATANDYVPRVFSEYRTAEQPKVPGTPANMESLLKASQPDALLAAADKLDGTLNNQSLVILFTVNKRKLLFVGDAQWGNWAYWLYGTNVSGKDPGILAGARSILESVDFYKVGHHGSTNANPIPAVTALSPTCVSMCSTESSDAYPDKKRPYGTISKDPNKKGTEVPRIALMEEMEKLTGKRLVRSDWIAVPPPNDVLASPEAKGQLAKLPPNFEQGDLYVDYIFPN